MPKGGTTDPCSFLLQQQDNLDGLSSGSIVDRTCALLDNVVVPLRVRADHNCMWHTLYVLHRYLELGLGILPKEEEAALAHPETLKDAIMRCDFLFFSIKGDMQHSRKGGGFVPLL